MKILYHRTLLKQTQVLLSRAEVYLLFVLHLPRLYSGTFCLLPASRGCWRVPSLTAAQLMAHFQSESCQASLKSHSLFLDKASASFGSKLPQIISMLLIYLLLVRSYEVNYTGRSLTFGFYISSFSPSSPTSCVSVNCSYYDAAGLELTGHFSQR